MNPTRLVPITAIALVWLSLSCATDGFVPGPPSMPIARLGLAPEHRIFHDTLVDYGDWILIEPHGYVFRPRVAFESWNPYGDGFWVPTDIYGWVWISREPFGWATYHYGRWLADPFQGWVWMPGTEWGPGWVTWTGSSGFVGWAPLPPSGYSMGSVPRESYQFVQTGDLGSTNLKDKLLASEHIPVELQPQAIVNDDIIEGVRFNRGPSFDVIERAAGPLTLIEIEAVVPGQPTDVTSDVAATPPDPIKATRRAARVATTQARQVSQGTPPPTKLPLVRLSPVKKSPKLDRRGKPSSAKRDSTN